MKEALLIEYEANHRMQGAALRGRPSIAARTGLEAFSQGALKTVRLWSVVTYLAVMSLPVSLPGG